MEMSRSPQTLFSWILCSHHIITNNPENAKLTSREFVCQQLRFGIPDFVHKLKVLEKRKVRNVSKPLCDVVVVACHVLLRPSITNHAPPAKQIEVLKHQNTNNNWETVRRTEKRSRLV